MRIAAIAPVGSSTTTPVESVHWQESYRVRAVKAEGAEAARKFQEVIKRLEEQPHRRRMRVIEVVSAPGVRSGMVRVDG